MQRALFNINQAGTGDNEAVRAASIKAASDGGLPRVGALRSLLQKCRSIADVLDQTISLLQYYIYIYIYQCIGLSATDMLMGKVCTVEY